MTIPFAAVTSTGDTITHLVAVSPALVGASPDSLPPSTLCGQTTRGEAPGVHPADAECGHCFEVAPYYMALPAYGVLQ